MVGSLLVLGDLVVAWDLLLKGSGDGNLDTAYDPDESVEVRRCSAGALHVANALRVRLEGVCVLGPMASADGGEAATRVYNVWSSHPIHREEKEDVHRLKTFLGTEKKAQPPEWIQFVTVPDDAPRVIVVSDDDMGYRNGDQGPNVLTSWQKWQVKPWVVWKYRHPTARGARDARPPGAPNLLGALTAYSSPAPSDADTDELYKQAIAIVSADTLREQHATVSRNRSWEDVSAEVLQAVQADPELKRFRWVVVSFGAAGALVVSSEPPSRSTLIFDPARLEGDWEREHPGKVVGATTCVLIHVSIALFQQEGTPDQATIERGVLEGMWSLRTIQRLAYSAAEPPDANDKPYDAESEKRTHPTTAAILLPGPGVVPGAKKFRSLCTLAKVHPPAPGPLVGERRWLFTPPTGDSDGRGWREIQAAAPLEIARAILDVGVEKALRAQAVPHVRYGDLFSVEPGEINSLRALHQALSYYLHPRSSDKKPLSIAVFGPPGSGKSFAVKQIARALDLRESDVSTFNLSQLSGPDMLVGALHQVRNRALAGRVPLVFWDEFDTSLGGTPLGWLRYFLAPMQDGEFQEGQSTHPIGRAVFVFAGGTSETYQGLEEQRHEHRAAKVPDFVSRLRGSLDVRGINPPAGGAEEAGLDFHVLRRAMLLRAALDRFGSKEMRVEEGLLDAFLGVPRYRHGARSLEAIVRSCALRGVRELTTSELPSRAQLAMHVENPDMLLRR